MSGWAQRDAEQREDEAEGAETPATGPVPSVSFEEREAVLREFHPNGGLGYATVRETSLAEAVVRMRKERAMLRTDRALAKAGLTMEREEVSRLRSELEAPRCDFASHVDTKNTIHLLNQKVEAYKKSRNASQLRGGEHLTRIAELELELEELKARVADLEGGIRQLIVARSVSTECEEEKLRDLARLLERRESAREALDA